MYVDKKLQGVLCVQALSRLNRSAPKLGKTAQDLFILDFENRIEDIKAAFEPYYLETILENESDIIILDKLKENLDETKIYSEKHIEEVVSYLLEANKKEEKEYIGILNEVIYNFDNLEDNIKKETKMNAKQFVKKYLYLSSICDVSSISFYKLYRFLKEVIPRMKIEDDMNDILEALISNDLIELSTLGIQKNNENLSIELNEDNNILTPNGEKVKKVGESGVEKSELDTIIEEFNKKWFEEWNVLPEEQKIIFEKIVQTIKEDPNFENEYKNSTNEEYKKIVYADICYNAILRHRMEYLPLYVAYQNKMFEESFINTIQRMMNI